ncbi:ubiquitin carboxyl-terminal hydrolase, family 1 [Dictyocaulus viviparus]|uniref:ubiquitinyl hydrolase 1 n=1 Tax=Dictyocaulus viviparus TaxID=29172 RepID=A0A0D8YAE5_DICVI|nr:ubiquitin carboxyl-terminal hydrolase, family 1 [Dictyocaulus viviparus]
MSSPMWRALESNPETMNAGLRYFDETCNAVSDSEASSTMNLFFMKQKIGNACGTFALFHALGNLEGVIDLGDGLFFDWLVEAKSLSPEERSDFLLKDAQLAAAHDETARMGETEETSEIEHHFICYIIKDDNLYEIDSCASHPRLLGKAFGKSLVVVAGEHIKKLMLKIGDVSFSAMALIKSS